jgi:hypothetical protein
MYSELFEKTYYECILKPLFEQILRETDEEDNIGKIQTNIKQELQRNPTEINPTTREIVDNLSNYLQNGIDTLWVDIETRKTSTVKVFPAKNLRVRINGKEEIVDFFKKEEILGRKDIIGGIIQTLQQPNLIINQPSSEYQNKKDDKRIYAKSFVGESKNYPNDHCKPIQLAIALQKQRDGSILFSLIHSVRNSLEKISQKIANKNSILYQNFSYKN